MALLVDGKFSHTFRNADAVAKELPEPLSVLSTVTWRDFLTTIERDQALVGAAVKYLWAATTQPKKLKQMNDAVATAQKLFTTRKAPPLGSRLTSLDPYAIKLTGGYKLPFEALCRSLCNVTTWKPRLVSYESIVHRYKKSDLYWKSTEGQKILEKDAKIAGGLYANAPRMSVLHPAPLKLDAEFADDAFSVDAILALEHTALRRLLLESKRAPGKGVRVEKGRLVVPFAAVCGLEALFLFEYLLSTPEVFLSANRAHESVKYQHSSLTNVLRSYDNAASRAIATWGRNKVIPPCLEKLRLTPHLKHEDRKTLARAIAAGIFSIEATKLSSERGQRAECIAYAKKFEVANDYEKGCTKACGKICPYAGQREACFFDMTGEKVPVGSLHNFTLTQMAMKMSHASKPDPNFESEYSTDSDDDFNK